MPKPTRHCIFCGQPGTTREHLFGLWLRKIFPRDESTTHTMGQVSWPANDLSNPDLTLHKKQGHSGSRQLKVVCRSCNNGWMAQTEERTASVLTPLINGETTTITPQMQKLLAAWAVKTAIVSEYMDARQIATPMAQRDELRRTLLAPESWHVWICGYNESDWRDLAAFQQVAWLEVPAVDGSGLVQHYIEANLFGLKHLLVMVLTTSWSLVQSHLTRFDFRGIHRIWPPHVGNIAWPPDYMLGDFEAHTLSAFVNEALHYPVNPAAEGTPTP